ncbi:hypothetical protein CC86DRAFT_430353 [Ophiobolus disseminans]|uniref:Uncharacterized protein n=1 Tax=Ophiobolus disseminans TaxID=1469910 RepID=A0A6A6ZH01_9PLEO|nr:hypothetical protein CC86DRAFT_430353 [Ophiobolus disseminans]
MVSGSAGACSAPISVAGPGGGYPHAPLIGNPWLARENRDEYQKRGRRARQAASEAKQAKSEAKRAKFEAKRAKAKSEARKKKQQKHGAGILLARFGYKILKTLVPGRERGRKASSTGGCSRSEGSVEVAVG